MYDVLPRFSKLCALLCLLVLLALTAGCGGSETDSESAVDEAPTPTDAEPVAATDAPPQPVWLAASHILIRYAGSARAGAEVTRTKEEAQALAAEIAEIASGAGQDFAALARERSEGPSAPQGGDLGQFPSDRMVPEFSKAVLAMKPGDVSAPVETPFGFHVIRRGDEVQVAGARHIIVMHAESARKPPSITRTKDEALERCEEALSRVDAGDDFATLAAEFSDGPSAPQGGDLGTFPKGAMVPEFDAALFALAKGETSKVVESPFGYHIIRRY